MTEDEGPTAPDDDPASESEPEVPAEDEVPAEEPEPEVPAEDHVPAEEPEPAPEPEPELAPSPAPALLPRRVMATADDLEAAPRRLDLDWLVPAITIVVILGLLGATIVWTLNGGNFFGFPGPPQSTSNASARTPTPSPSPTPSDTATPEPTAAPAPDPNVAAPTFISFGAPTSVTCIAPTGDEPVAAVAFTLSWGALDAESATVSVDGAAPQTAEATGTFAATFPCPAASASYVVTLVGRGGTIDRSVTVANIGYAG